VEVANTSASIRHSDLNRIFEKFGRGSDAISRNIPGKGLGLYLSREIVRAHGSDVTVTTGPASMTVFGFELEIAE
ncbi:MAG: Osmosensitive K+ channel histidine kinase KdpD, partial [uncultured Chloroflexia bacterium]